MESITYSTPGCTCRWRNTEPDFPRAVTPSVSPKLSGDWRRPVLHWRHRSLIFRASPTSRGSGSLLYVRGRRVFRVPDCVTILSG